MVARVSERSERNPGIAPPTDFKPAKRATDFANHTASSIAPLQGAAPFSNLIQGGDATCGRYPWLLSATAARLGCAAQPNIRVTGREIKAIPRRTQCQYR